MMGKEKGLTYDADPSALLVNDDGTNAADSMAMHYCPWGNAKIYFRVWSL